METDNNTKKSSGKQKHIINDGTKPTKLKLKTFPPNRPNAPLRGRTVGMLTLWATANDQNPEPVGARQINKGSELFREVPL